MRKQRYPNFHHYNRQSLSMPLAVSLLILFLPWFCFAEVRTDKVMEILRNSPRIIDSRLVLRGFVKGEHEVHVIVNFEKPRAAQDIKSLEDLTSRRRLKDAIMAAQDKIINSLDLNEVSINRRFSYIPGFAASVTLKGLNELIKLPEVISTGPDRILHAHLAQGIPLVNASTVRAVYNGQGVAIAICDTGIDYNHPKLGNGGFPNTKVIGGYDFGGSSNIPPSEDDDPMDQHGHGTNCAGIAAGDAPGQDDYIGGVAQTARLYAIKISYGATGAAYESDMIAGWEWCITHQYDDPNYPVMVISTSFGGGGYSDVCDYASTAMTLTAENCVSAGMTLFVSSGNDGFCDSISWPACISHVISVGAVFDANIGGFGFCVDPSSCAPNQEYHALCEPDYVAWAYTTQGGQVTPYSNVASFLDIFGPSHNTSTTTLGGSYVNNFGGTSAACPYAAGVGACMQSAAKASTGSFLLPAQVKSKLIASGDPIIYEPAGLTKPMVNLGAIDIDDDGMAADWEITYFSDLSHDGTGDTDADSLTDLQEYQYATDPTNPDTDGDQMPDGWEVTCNLNPTSDDAGDDPDQDGFTNLQEYNAGTNPQDSTSCPQAVPALTAPGFLVAMLFLLAAGLIMRRNRKG